MGLVQACKVSLNNKNTKYSLFYKKFSKYNLFLKLPVLKVADNKIKRKIAIKLWRIILDKNTFLEEHVCKVKTKLPKNIRLLYYVKSLLEEKILKSIYFASICLSILELCYITKIILIELN